MIEIETQDLERALGELGKTLLVRVAETRRSLGRRILDGAAARTPVRSGRARAGWTMTDGGEPFGETLVANEVPYIGALEFGESGRAPVAMLRTTIAEVAAEESPGG